MKIPSAESSIILPALLLLQPRLAHAVDAPILDESFLELAHTAAKLSALAYESNFTAFETGNNGTYSHPDYDEFTLYTDEPDQAILAAVDGRCIVAFRGTNANLADCKLFRARSPSTICAVARPARLSGDANGFLPLASTTLTPTPF